MASRTGSPAPLAHLVAPLSAPRVLDQPVGQVVRAVVLGAIPHRQHAMVERGAALGVKHAAAVQLEGALRGGAGQQRMHGGSVPDPDRCCLTCGRMQGPGSGQGRAQSYCVLRYVEPTWSASMATDTGWLATAFMSATSSLGGTSA